MKEKVLNNAYVAIEEVLDRKLKILVEFVNSKIDDGYLTPDDANTIVTKCFPIKKEIAGAFFNQILTNS